MTNKKLRKTICEDCGNEVAKAIIDKLYVCKSCFYKISTANRLGRQGKKKNKIGW